MSKIKVSVVIPCYNEEKTIEEVITKVLSQKDIVEEVIVIDDSSTDRSKEIISRLSQKDSKIKFFFKDKNEGKGSALIKGFELSKEEIILIQDADLEYDPSEYQKLIKPFIESNADVVYGSRFMGGDMVRLHFFWHFIANKILTFICNIVTNLNMSDMETGYKIIKKKYLNKIILREKSFGIEPELTVKLAKLRLVFYEVPISYKGRTYSEGKKIGLKDAFVAMYCIFKYKFFD